MAASGFTPIQHYRTATPAATPSAGNLVYGELALNYADGNLFFKDSSNIVRLLASTAAATGTVSSVQASGGTTGLTFTGGPITTSGTLTLGGTLAVANGGTGATSAANARTNLGAAASGANADITSMSGITGAIATADYVQFDTSNAVAPSAGQLAWNTNDGTLDVGLASGTVLSVGQEQMFYAKNTSGGTIAQGTPVMFTGTVGASGKLEFGLAVADGSVPAEYMMGVTAESIANNAFGYITTFGLIRGFNTSGSPYGETWADGDLLYFDPATPGTWTNVEPSAPNIHVPVAVVVSAASGGSGSIFVRMFLSQRLGELQDVIINGGGPSAGQVLIYDATQQRWENNTLTAGSNITITNADGAITIAASTASGTVTSVQASGGTTGLSFTGGPITSSGTLTLGGTLGVANGGTGATSITSGRLVKGNGTGAFTASGIEDNSNALAITIDSSENVGIGIASPAVKLDVGGVVRSNVGGGNTRIEHDGTNGTLASSTALLVYADGANDIIFHTNATRRMRVTGAGNVGIGTDSPSERLSVVGNITATGALTLGTALAVAQGGTGATDAGTARTNLSAAARSQTDQISGFIASPSNKLYRVAIKMAFAGTITETTTRSVSGTCTATFSINGSNLGGAANSVSSTEQSVSRTTSNTFAAGDDIELTVSSNSSCVDMSFTIAYTRTLA